MAIAEKLSSSNDTNLLFDLPEGEIAELTEQARDVSVETLLDYFDFMAAGDEGVARSATPRFALESVLVRLATLPQTLPVADLIERLERLEAKVPLGATQQLETARVGTSAAPSALSSEPPPALVGPRAVGAPSAARPNDAWREFVSFVRKEQKFLASHLEFGTALRLPPGALKIAVAERPHLAFLQDGDNLATLKDLAKRFFAQDVTVEIDNALTGPVENSTEDAPGESVKAGEARSDMVKEALRIFGGSIRNLRRDNG
jgi:DNA polymerase-3 subunit gamma/tau